METAFHGQSSLEASGHWHHEGTQVAYASEHPGVAILEKLVWLDDSETVRANNYVLLSLQIDPSIHLERLDRSELPENWDEYPHHDATRDIGTRWFEEERSAVLAVPSSIVPTAYNYLVNPLHPDFQALERGEPVPFSWDARLFPREWREGEDG